ncbi:MAG: hypothetical protein Kow0098_03590 [Ignavibacteriaceae bacterium]
MKIPFLKPGKFINAVTGKPVVIKPEDLDKILEATQQYNYQDDEFPLVVGHPKTDSPAYGYVKKNAVKKEGELLVAEADEKNLVKEFVEWFKKKLYKNVSVKLRPDLSIAHIGFLGANPPAVTGLPPVSFSDAAEGIEISFAEYEITPWYYRVLGTILRRIKNYIIQKEGSEEAEKLLPEYELTDLMTPPKIYDKKNTGAAAFSENNNQLSEEEMNELEKLKAEKEQLQKQLQDEQKKAKQYQDKLTETELKTITADVLAFCESVDVKRKIKDGEKQTVVNLLVNLKQRGPIEFSESGETKTIDPVEFVKSLIKRLPDAVELGEKFKQGSDDDANDDKKIGKKMAEMVNG